MTGPQQTATAIEPTTSLDIVFEADSSLTCRAVMATEDSALATQIEDISNRGGKDSTIVPIFEITISD